MNQHSLKLIKIIVFLIIIVLLDQVIGSYLRHLYFHQKAGQDYALTYSLQECKADIMIFGASQAQHNYDPRILKDSLKMSCYNAGHDGGHSILLQYTQIEIVSERYAPRVIILEFTPEKIVRYSGDYDRLSILLPYYKMYPEIYPIIRLRSPYERIKLLSAIYPFNSNVINIIGFNTRIRAAEKQDFEGYIPLKDQVMNIGMYKKDTEVIFQSTPDPNKIIALKDIIDICQKKRIKLFIISSPIFHDVSDKRPIPSYAANQVLEIFKSENVNYLDFTYDSLFNAHIEWFKDQAHLNDKGAEVFTKILSSNLKKYIGSINDRVQ
jgi:hypothetical protein